MGYSEATITASSFVVPPDAEGGALRTLRGWLATEFSYDLPLSDLDTGLGLFGFEACRDEQGMLTALGFEDQRLIAETEDFFIVLAPHVRTGSFIDWRSGRGRRWRYRFDGENLRTVELPDDS